MQWWYTYHYDYAYHYDQPYHPYHDFKRINHSDINFVMHFASYIGHVLVQ